ncbi:adhesion G protein-coupled receptor E1-like isoform X2 [Carassius auratus]|uniref:Adhesion G protein-coupled receptor E1-like isoform X2 n=1 Tax=Carassius auratus TaxID=7957 RepID=A0A6P6N5G7_CARAU|nr:adhesion G protein-coupled receptor E1-like isoform X2 [Carassius auratus]
MITVCRPGKIRSRGKCVDENECEIQPSICERNAACFNTAGSYYCQCHEGFTPPSPHNFTQLDGILCKDINECLVGSDDCGPNTTCVNTEGGYNCTCATGYISSNGKDIFNSGVQCIDRDECNDPSFCGKHASCHNTAGGFYCICEAGFRLKSGGTNFTDTSELCEKLKCDRFLSEKDASQTSPELTKLVSLITDSCLIMNQSESVNNNTQAHGEKLLKGFLSDLDDLNHGGFSGDNGMISALFRIVVNILKLIGHLLSASRTRKISAKAEVELLVKRGNSPPEGDFRMNISGAQLTSHWDTATGNTYHGFTTAALLSYKGLDESLNCCFDHLETQKKQTYKINSKVVTATFINTETTNLNKPIKLTFSHLEKKNEKHMCVFWDPELDGGAWSTLGCSTVSSRADQTVCSCNKLGSFAVLTVLCDTGVCRPTLNFCTLDSKP